jgi:hypothetical protein
MQDAAQPTRARSAVDSAALHPRCIVCGAGNPHGLGLRFVPSADGRGVEAAVDCRESAEGYAGRVAHTGELTVRFRHPVQVGRAARVRAWIERSHGRLHVVGADLWQDGRVKAVATAKFLEEPPHPAT